MTEEEYRQEMEERQRLINEIAYARNELIRAQQENQALKYDLAASQAAAIQSINLSKALAISFMPIMNQVAVEVDGVNQILNEVKSAIEDLAKRYTSIKNVSTATKNITQCDDEYQRKFRLYEKFRKVCIGYVIGIDNVIISNESLRTTLEKNYLANSDYWVAHCIMATMLWVNDEKEACMRALNQALQIDAKKSTIFFLLVNLRFGRNEAAKQWYNLYMDDIDVNDIGEEWQYLLQAYLYKVFGNDPVFEERINKQYEELLTETKKYSLNYEKQVIDQVKEFADAFPYNTDNEYELLKKHCKNYNSLIANLTEAQKNVELAKFYNDIFESETKSKDKLSRRIEDILYNLIKAYDTEEYEIIKKIKYNEYVIKAKGDIQAASKMYRLEMNQDSKKTLLDIIFKFAFSNVQSNVDSLVRKFAINLLLDLIKEGYLKYREYYRRHEIDKPTFVIDGCEINGNENTINESRETINKHYKKLKPKVLSRDKKHKGLSIAWGISLAVMIVSMIIMIYNSVNKNISLPSKITIIVFVVSLLLFGLFLFLSILRRRKVLKDLRERQIESLKTLTLVMDELSSYHEDYRHADEKYVVLQETLEKFRK